MSKVLFIEKSERIPVGKDENLMIFDILLDGEKIDRKIEINLDGEGAFVEIYGLFFGTENQEFVSSHIVNHNASHTSSVLLTKGVLNDKAKMNYTSSINIKKGSVGCNGEQKEDTLLLSRDAHVDAVPALKIANDDVKASHSVSTTYIDDLKKFYLESRGMSEEEVVRAVVEGHFSEILDRLDNEAINIDIKRKIDLKLIEH